MFVNQSATQPVVTPNAVAALSEAFRQGQISADDIIERYGSLANAKRKATLDVLPSATTAQIAQNQLAAAQAGAAQQNVPLAAEAQKTGLESAIFQAQQAAGSYDAKMNYILQRGGKIPEIDLDKGLTPAQKKEIDSEFSDVAQWDMTHNLAGQFASASKPHPIEKTVQDSTGKTTKTTEFGKLVIGPTGAPIDPKMHHQAVAISMLPYQMWKQAGRPKFWDIFGVKPGETEMVTPRAGAAPSERPMVSPFGGGTSGEIVTEEKEPAALEQAQKIMEPVRKTDSYKTWDSAKAFFKGMEETIAEINKVPIEDQRAGKVNLNLRDIALVSDFIKLYDPTAVIREFKWDKIQSSQPLPSVVRDWVERVFRYGQLTPETRQDVFKEGQSLYRAKERSVQADLQRAARQAADAGADPALIFNDDEKKLISGRFTESSPSAASAPSGRVVTLPSGKKLALVNGQWQYVQ
jgi:hypothetical protein